MNPKKYTVDNVLLERPLICEYPKLTAEVRELVDYTVAYHQKPNPKLRVLRWFGRRTVQPIAPDLWSLPWPDIVLLRAACESIADATEIESLYDVLSKVYNLSKKQFYTLAIFDAVSSYLWIVEQLLAAGTTEAEHAHRRTQFNELQAQV